MYKKPKQQNPDEPLRVRTPRENQVLGVIEERLGNRRSKVRCSDDAIRICRIPGRVRRRMWTKEGDVVMIEPWSVQTDVRGDLVYIYTKPQIEWLRKKHFLDWM